MTMRQDEIGGCDFLDVLEEAVLTKKTFTVKLRSGETFTDQIRDVVTANGQDYVDFLNHERVATADIYGLREAEPTRH